MNIHRNLDSEWQARIDLAAMYRAAAMLGLDAGIDNHYTLMLPGSETRFLSHRYGLHFSEVTASNLIMVDADQGAVESSPGHADMADVVVYHLHWSIHRARPDARCILHTHQPHATALTMVKNGRLQMSLQDCLRFYDRVAYHDAYGGNEVDEDEGARLVEAIGDKDILFLKHHGMLICGPTVGEAFDDMFYLERACQAQILARSAGELETIPDAAARATGRSFEENLQWKEAHFAAIKRVLDRSQPDYAS